MVARAYAAGVSARWLVADSFYGRGHDFRRWLEEKEQPYVVGVLPGQVVEYGGQRQRATALAQRAPSDVWARRSAGEGSRGPRLHDWAVIALSEACAAGRGRWLPVRRSPEDPTDCAFFRAYGPAGASAEELVRVAGTRWAIEEGFAQAKGEVGMDQYEVRRWGAWHRFVTLALLAHAYLAIASAAARRGATDTREKGAPLAIPSWSRSRSRRSAGSCSRPPWTARSGNSAWAGRAGAAPTRPWPGAATSPAGSVGG
jgi:SRSO17 transposase